MNEATRNERSQLPQLTGKTFLTDGGLETFLIFQEGHDLPEFAAFDLLKDEAGEQALHDYYLPYLDLAVKHGYGFIFETPTWRASPDWAARIGYDRDELDALNRKAVALMARLRDEYSAHSVPTVISGCVGPQGDGYNPELHLSATDAERYHSTQIRTFAEAGADMVSAITMTYVEEATGITAAAQAQGVPVAISFTVETDGRLPSGQPLDEAIDDLDSRTDHGPAYYMVNCAHPTHFDEVVEAGGPWVERIRGIRANASTMSHAELDEAPTLDDGDPVDLGSRYAALSQSLPNMSVLGGCCGTDHRHVAAICKAWEGR